MECRNFRTSVGTSAVVIRLGAIGSSLTITDCIMHDNANTSAAAGGGAVTVLQTVNTLSIDRSVFYSNSHGLNGGALYCVASTATIANSVFYDNQAGGSGSAHGGGAIRFQTTAAGGVMNIYNCTITGNRVPNGAAVGGGICAPSTSGTTINVYDSIVAGNTGPGGGASDTASAGSGMVNLFGVTTGSASGLFVNLGSGGSRDLRLVAGSPAIDAGGTTSSSPAATFDVLNNPRKIGSNFDRGAYEYHAARTLDLDANDSSGTTGNNYSASGASTQNVTVNVADTDVAAGALSGDINVRAVTFTLSGVLNGSSESLLLTGNNPNINPVAYDSGTSRLMLYSKPAASVADMQDAIRNLVFSNSAANPTAGARAVSILIYDASDSAVATATITLASANTPPTVNANTGLTLNEGGLALISDSALDFNDLQQADSAITYTVTLPPTNGELLKSGSTLALNDTFTQADIADGSIRYAHSGTDTGSDSFGFTVSDGAGGSVTDQSFSFTLTAVNDATVLGATPTISFNSAPGGSFALDGQDGSSDVAGIALEIYFADADINRINNLITFEDPYAVGAANSGLAINYSGSEGSHFVILKSRNNGDNFWLQSLQLSDYGGNNVSIEAFDNGVSQGSVNVTVNSDPWYFTFDNNGALTPAIFRNADEIRIKGQDSGVIWITVNDVKLAAPVSNNAPTDMSISNFQMAQSGGVNAVVGTLSTTDADGADSHTYTLVSGTDSTHNGLFNISGSTLRANNAANMAPGGYSVRIQTDDGNGGTYAEAFTLTVVDDVAPSAPASFTASAVGGDVSLMWVNPVDAGFASTTIRRSNVSFPATIDAGTLIAQGLTGTSQPDNGLADGTYYYAIFALDGAGNVSLAATASVTVDTIAPTISISSPSAPITQNGPVTFTLTWSDANFNASSISLVGNQVILNTTGNATVNSISVSGSGTSRTVELAAITGSGTVGISLPANTGSDLAGNQALAAGPSATFIVNTSPTVAVDNAAVTIGEGSSVTNTGTFSDADGNATANLSASTGSLTPDNGAGTWRWTLNATDGPEEPQTVTVTIEDGVATNIASFTLTVTNLAPSAIAQSITTPEDVSTNIVLTATDPGLDTITNWVVTVSPTNGVLSGTASQLVYAPATNFNGGDSFKFTATDSDGDESIEATVSITVMAVNDPPSAGADGIARLNTARTAKVTKVALLANDTDPDDDTLTIIAVGNATPSGAAVAMAGNFVIYTAPSTNGGDGSFTYTLSDGAGGHSVTHVVPVTEVASMPVGSGPNYAAIAASGSDFILTFIGVPERLYRVQYTTSLAFPFSWNEFSPLAVYTTPANGIFNHTDFNPPGPIRLYRAVPHP